MADTEWPRWACSYRFGRDGAEYCITIPARSAEEAADRLRAIGAWGKVDGELMMTIPAVPGGGLLVRAIAAFRNLRHRWSNANG